MNTELNKKGRLGVILLVASLLLLSVHIAYGEDYSGSGSGDVIQAAAPAPDSSQIEKFSTEELHTLVAPVALYPDALLAQVLPAAAFPDQIGEANRFVEGGGNADSPPSDTQWDSSVIALLHYPTVLKKLNDDPQWTEQLGLAATYQMDDVSQAVQQVRSEAQAVGNLTTNDKQVVSSDAGAITIVPANPQVIYVPQYDPYYIYERRLDDPFIWGTGFSFGLWLGNTWDWRSRHIWVNSRWDHGGWHRYDRPSYWHGSYNRSIPSWYRRVGGSYNGYGNRVSPRGFPSRDRIQNSRVFGTQNRTPGSTPRTNWHNPSFDSRDFNNRANQTRIESQRGQNSRIRPTPQVQSQPAVRPQAPVTRPAPVQRQESVTRPAPQVQRQEPVARPQPQVQRPAPVQRTPVQRSSPSFNESFGSSRGAVQSQSSRGAASRGSGGGHPSGGGGGGHGTGGGGRGGGHR